MANFKVSYREDTALFQNLWVKSWLVILIVAMLVLPFLLSRYQLSILIEMGIAVIGALGLNLLIGYTGQISLGHGAFVAIGAYTSGLLAGTLGVPFLISLPLSGMMAALLSLIVGIPSLRLKGLYLALGTLAFGFIIEYILFHWELTRGDTGMAVPKIGMEGFYIETERQFFFLIMFFAVIAAFVAKNIARTKIGRSFVAIRDRDIAAEAMGISLSKYKIMAFAIAAFYAGVAGSLMAYYQKWIVPGNFDITLSIAYIAMIVLGGMGTVLGSILGAIMITGIPHAIVYLTDAFRGTYPNLSNLIVDLKLGIFGLVIVLTLLFEPQGLVGIYRRIKIYWKTWPFKY
ncbi:MAG: branched-chain amino acid ABC transporter permease [Deltaproteobacteria bacterium HGW-Deltaproteobacteria-9]|nr:MAG: branched-chain amino acid ABC transporter permease [Deltaproteobacteria bacterium HGW-Deltaproteobacteria-9]